MTAEDGDTDEFEATLTDAFTDHGADAETAAAAAENVAQFRADHDGDLTTERVLDAVADSEYETFTHRFDDAMGELAGQNEDCTDSRAYRLGGFGDLAADPTQGA